MAISSPATGIQYLTGFERKQLPAFHYEFGAAKLLKRVFMPHGSNTVIVEYENSGDVAFAHVLFVLKFGVSEELLPENQALILCIDLNQWKENMSEKNGS